MISLANSLLPSLASGHLTNVRGTHLTATKVSLAAKSWFPARDLAISDKTQSQPTKKPDLRRAGVNNRPRNVVLVTCFLVMVYMYPMIFKPLFGIGESETLNDQAFKERIEKARPSNMPKWTSPFGPKSGDN